MESVTILGFGSHGRDLECIAIDCGRFVTPLDDAGPHGLDEYDPTFPYVLGAWEPRLRHRLFVRVQGKKGLPATLIHPAARIGRDCTIAPGCVIGPGAILTNDVHLGVHVHVGAGALLTRCEVGPFSTISNGATVLGDVTIGSTVLVGGNAVVRNLLTVGDGAVIGCGANVIRDVEPNTAVAGNPAKTLGIVP